jgi:hypothetical protein
MVLRSIFITLCISDYAQEELTLSSYLEILIPVLIKSNYLLCNKQIKHVGD